MAHPATVVKVEINGEKQEYKLTKNRPVLLLGLEDAETFRGESDEQAATRRARELLDSAFMQLGFLTNERRFSLLSAYGLTETAQSA